MKSLLATFILFISYTTSAYSFEVGDTVLAECGYSTSLGEILEISDRGNAFIEFENFYSQVICEDEIYDLSNTEVIRSYEPAESYEILETTRGGIMSLYKKKTTVLDTIKLSDKVSFRCGDSIGIGEITDITSDGMFSMSFENSIINNVCGSGMYFDINKKIKQDSFSIY